MLRCLKIGLIGFVMMGVQVAYASGNQGANERRLPPRLNHVTQVEVNGVDVKGKVTLSQISRIFKQTYAYSGMQYRWSDRGYAMHIWFQGRGSFLSFKTDLSGLPKFDVEAIHDEFQRGGKSPRWETLLKRNDGKWLMQSDLVGVWEIRWHAMESFQDELKLDGVVISPKMTFSDFAKVFPWSVRAQSYFQDGSEKEPGKEAYYVTLDPMTHGDLNSWDHLKFVFHGGKLVEIELKRALR